MRQPVSSQRTEFAKKLGPGHYLDPVVCPKRLGYPRNDNTPARVVFLSQGANALEVGAAHLAPGLAFDRGVEIADPV